MTTTPTGADRTTDPAARQDRPRGRTLRLLAPLVALGLLAACSAADDTPATPAPSTPAPATEPAPDAPDAAGAPATVTTASGSLGTFLTDGDGRTLYLFTPDSPGVSTCTDACLQAWPALVTDGAPEAAGMADATLLGTLVRDDGGVQVTYAGWPLYAFAGDTVAGDVNGQGVEGVWFLVAPDGTMLDAATPDAPASGGNGTAPARDDYGY